MSSPDNPREHPDSIRPEAMEPEDDDQGEEGGEEEHAKPETDSDSAHRNAR